MTYLVIIGGATTLYIETLQQRTTINERYKP